MGIAHPFSHQHCSHKSRNTQLIWTTVPPAKSRASMPPLVPSQPPLTPYPVCKRIIHERCPQQREDQEGAEFHTFCYCPGNERRRDDGEHALVNHVCLVGNRRSVIRVRGSFDSDKPQPIKTADQPPVIRTESKGVPPQDPLHADQTPSVRSFA